ncbi:hypothetical protein [Pedobacter polysacchareus]|uniref:hypothetical protein n=1 Tax=Pedobacter polysacchareus TaxID=2861973 RepID=UPI001C99475A|nr:hypothetical protein [Pedobacter polysacchareus]
MERIKLYLVSIIFIFLFLAPNTLYVFLSDTATKVLFLFLFTCYILFFLINFKGITSKIYIYPFSLTMVFVVFGTLNLIVKGTTETFNILGPIITYLAFYYAYNYQIKSSVIGIYLLGLYIYYFIVYYSTLPSLLIHPELEDFFGKASSNAIPITINITLYAYMIMNKFLDQNNKRKIILFAFTNLVLIIIQQSRAGIIIAILILLVACFDYSKRIAYNIIGFIGIVIMYVLIFHFQVVSEYFDLVGAIDTNSIKDDIRGDAQAQFFNGLNLNTTIFGYDKGNFSGLMYTYNVFLDVWNRYGIVSLIILGLTFIYRIIFYKKFKFPLYFFIPFLVYSLVESQFFPNFWDIIIYLMLFSLKKDSNSALISSKNNVQKDSIINAV